MLGDISTIKLQAKYLRRLHDEMNGDTEADHGTADQILCDLLTELGFTKVVEAYDEIDKWYA